MRNSSRKFPSLPLCAKFKPGTYLSAYRDTHTLENKNNLCAVIKSPVIISPESQDWQQTKVPYSLDRALETSGEDCTSLSLPIKPYEVTRCSSVAFGTTPLVYLTLDRLLNTTSFLRVPDILKSSSDCGDKGFAAKKKKNPV